MIKMAANHHYRNPQPLPSDPRSGNYNNMNQQKPICRQYVWGTCMKGAHCKFRHELDLEEMKKILKFCHNYQNKTGCFREDCSYLHATREEQDRFLKSKGPVLHLPRVLAERYAAMSEPSHNVPNYECMPHAPMAPMTPMLATTLMPPPPPPPPPPPQPQPQPQQPVQQPPPTPVAIEPGLSGSMVMRPQAVQHLHGAPTTLQPMPPAGHQPVEASQPQQQMIDTSIPPPPIQFQPRNDALKRQLDTEAGPSKLRKLPIEDSKVAEKCENCFHLEIRTDVYKHELTNVNCGLKCQRLEYQNRLNEFEMGMDILRALVRPDSFRRLEEYIEDEPPQIIMRQQIPLLSLVTSFLTSRRNAVDAALSPSLRSDDMFSIPSSPRLSLHSSNINDIPRNTNKDMLSNSNNNTAKPPPTTLAPVYRPYHPAVPPPVSSPPPVERSFYTSPNTNKDVVNNDRVGSSNSNLPPPPTAGYPSYHPGVPPPPPPAPVDRPYYGATPSTPMPNMAFNNSMPQVTGPTPRQVTTLPSTMAAPMPPPHYMMGRFPHPPQYYPPFQ